jgi:release factor glutamine methyltransferase
MTITETLGMGTKLLRSPGIDSPGLDASLLLAETLGISREQLILRGPEPLREPERRRFLRLIDRRIAGECTAYILGRREFRGLDFVVSPAVLVPRPDTETLVEAALGELGVVAAGAAGISLHPQTSSHPSLLDLCTGSGAVAIALKHECPETTVFASDLSPQALEIARLNAARLLGTMPGPAAALALAETGPQQPRQRDVSAPAVTFVQSDLFARISRRFHLITANPPYVRTGDIEGLPQEVRGEPRLALDGGADGLDLIRAIIAGAPEHLFAGGVLLLEADPRQMPPIACLLEHQGFMDIQSYRDLSGAARVISGRLKPGV